MKTFLAGLLCLWAFAATAEDLPALYDVTGVASNDVLNIRDQPKTGMILGALAYNARSVEVIEVSADGGWLRVSTGETSGWASGRYMARQSGQDGAIMSRRLSCSGTEPFWGVDLPGDNSVVFEEVGVAPATGAIALASSVNRTDKEGFIARLTGDLLITGVVTRGYCSDGMSDRTYALTLDMIVNGPGGDALFSGCCSLR